MAIDAASFSFYWIFIGKDVEDTSFVLIAHEERRVIEFNEWPECNTADSRDLCSVYIDYGQRGLIS